MINEVTFQEESPGKLDRALAASIKVLQSPRSPRVVEQIVVANNGSESPVRQRIISYEGSVSKELLQRLEERFQKTEQQLASRIRQLSASKVSTRGKSPIASIQPSAFTQSPPQTKTPAILQTEQTSPRITVKSPSRTRPFCSEYVMRLNTRKRQTEELMKQYERSRNRLDELIAASQQL